MGNPSSLQSAWIQSSRTSVLIEKFLSNFVLDAEGALAEAFDGSQDVVGGFGPSERFGCSETVIT